jgi:phosphate/sulfate permease
MNFPIIVVMVVVTALAFDFTNGFHDTANAMATSIATGALRPKVAVLIAGVLNLIGAILWNLLTWLFGMPSRRPVTSHNVNDVPTAGAEPVGASA